MHPDRNPPIPHAPPGPARATPRRHDGLLARLTLGALALSMVAIPVACFDPERYEDDDDDDDADDDRPSMCQSDEDCSSERHCMAGTCVADDGGSCIAFGTTCEVNGDCCDFDGTTDVGAGLCVNYGGAAVCTEVCTSHGDCDTGCCGALTDEDEYGACAAASVCESDPPPANETCVAGVFVFCACAAAAEVPCSDESLETFLGSCSSDSSELVPVFECYASYAESGTEQCGEAIDMCGIDAQVEREPPLATPGPVAHEAEQGRACGHVSASAPLQSLTSALAARQG